MNRESRINHLINQAFKPDHYEIRNDSHLHAGHAGSDGSGETHYHLKIQSKAFHGLSRVKKQRLVYHILADEWATGLHALSMELD